LFLVLFLLLYHLITPPPPLLPIAFLLLILCLLLLLVLLLVVLLLLLHAPHAELCFRPPLAVSKRSESQPTFPIRDGNGNGFLIGAFSLNKLEMRKKSHLIKICFELLQIFKMILF